MLRRALLFIALVPGLVACSSAAAPTPAEGAPSGGRPTTAGSPPPFATVPPSTAPVTGEVPPDVIAMASADLTKRTGIDPSTFVVIRSEQAIWSDGSLGCRIPGQVYIQVQTPGYWIVLTANGKSYDYRATEAGAVQLCEGLQPLPPSG